MKMSVFRALLKFILVQITILSAFAANVMAENYTLSKKSKIGFEVTKFMVLSVDGVFKDFGGHLSLNENGDINALNIQVSSISVSTGKEKRDKFAREKLLNAANYPTIDFRLISYKPTTRKGTIQHGKITAKITMHGTTKNVPFTSEIDTAAKPLKITIKGKVNNKDFQMKGKMTTSNDVHLNLRTLWE